MQNAWAPFFHPVQSFERLCADLPSHISFYWMRLTAPGTLLRPDAFMVSRTCLIVGTHWGAFQPLFHFVLLSAQERCTHGKLD